MRRSTSKSVNSDSTAVGVDDRRRSERRPSFSMAIVWVGDQRFKARVIDESQGGLGLHVPAGTPVKVDLKLRIESNGMRQCATIRHVTEHDDGSLRLGLSWDY